MGLSGYLSILVPFILLGGVQELGLVEGFLSKYWELSPLSGEMELRWEERTNNSIPEKCFPHLSLGSWWERGEILYLDSSFQVRCLRQCRKLSVATDLPPLHHHYERRFHMKPTKGTGKLKGLFHKKGHSP